MSDVGSTMLGSYRAKSMGKHQAAPVPAARGATMSPRTPNTLDAASTSATPSPDGATLGLEGARGLPGMEDGNGHMGSWADKEHPL